MTIKNKIKTTIELIYDLTINVVTVVTTLRKIESKIKVPIEAAKPSSA
jgi:hypothetical protein